MKYIFLDIDGVLNSDVYTASQKYIAECEALGLSPTGNDVLNKAHYLHLDMDAMQLLNSFVEKSKAKVIISSTWRKRYSLVELRSMFEKRGATFEIAGVTPAKMSWRPRGYDIRSFFNELNGVTPDAFVIIDDVDEFSLYPNNFVQTSESVGLTQENVEKAWKILGVDSSTSVQIENL